MLNIIVSQSRLLEQLIRPRDQHASLLRHLINLLPVATDRSVAVKLTALISASRSKSRSVAMYIESDMNQSYRLCNSGMCYRKAMASEPTRTWLTSAA